LDALGVDERPVEKDIVVATFLKSKRTEINHQVRANYSSNENNNNSEAYGPMKPAADETEWSYATLSMISRRKANNQER
jgi:hypothetical protein